MEHLKKSSYCVFYLIIPLGLRIFKTTVLTYCIIYTFWGLIWFLTANGNFASILCNLEIMYFNSNLPINLFSELKTYFQTFQLISSLHIKERVEIMRSNILIVYIRI